MLKRIRPDQVIKGMHIHSFEGGWLSHPFWRTRFLLDNDDDLARVRSSAVTCVVIDDAKGQGIEQPASTGRTGTIAAHGQAKTQWIDPARPQRRIWPATAGQQTPDAMGEDRKQATRVVTNSKRVMKQVLDGVRLGKAIRLADVTSVVDEISNALDRNRSMLIGMMRLKSKHEYTYFHSVAVCTLMVNLAREIGLDSATVRLMGLAGLLHDVGKMTVDEAILDKPGRLTDAEFDEVRCHTSRGHAVLLAGEDVPVEALDVCLHHHERIDGTGYPFGLAGKQISMAARMAAICDVYDAVTSVRAYKDSWTPAAAIAAMDGWAGHFDRELLFRFMRSIEVFPVGLLVRLRSNRLAVVMDNGVRASQAKLRAFYAIADRAFIEPCNVVLSDTLAGDQVIGCEDPAAWGFGEWDAMCARLLAGETAWVPTMR